MLRNYLKVAIRNLLRSKTFSFINILGLSLGMACSLLIFLWVESERSVDNFHANIEHLYSVYQRTYADGKVKAEHATPALLGDELKKAVPEVMYASGFITSGKEAFQVGDNVQNMAGARAGRHFFTMFSYPLLAGTPATALESPNSLAISRKMAEVYFGGPQNAVGKTMRFNNEQDLQVSAVFENLPADASDQYDYVLNWDGWMASQPFVKTWNASFVRTYLQLRPGADPRKVENKIKGFLASYVKPVPGVKHELGLQRFGDVYLHSTFENGIPAGGRVGYVTLFSGVALFMLLIACINFMNLATARAVKRAKEVGVRKVVGSTRSYLAGQFMGEALLLALFALVVSLLFVGMVLPAFNTLTGKQMIIPVLVPSFWLVLLGLVAVTGLLAGSYPALFLSALQPLQVLKGSLRFSAGATWFRKGLVVFQFILSILLLIVTMVVSRQTDYVRNKNLGYDRENLIYVPLEGDLVAKYKVFKQEASAMPGIRLVDRTGQLPHDMRAKTTNIDWEGKDPNTAISFAPARVGYDFVALMGLKVIKGRPFSRQFVTDSSAYLVNEEAVARMGFKDPLGKEFALDGKKGRIIGVLRNFHINSLHQPIEPLAIALKEDMPFGLALIRTQPGETRQALASLEKLCKQINPNYPFTFQFADEEYAKLYKSEQIITTLTNVFALLAIFISCLGLLGLAMFSAEQRTKEIGIRKVLGASEASIVTMFSKDFLKLVAISFLIATPLATYAVNKWLQGFAYRVELSWWIIAVAGALTLAIALLTVSLQVLGVAMTNPVRTLRAE
jgi:ABC-type antimicrobial peptide transport system permease subunit